MSTPITAPAGWYPDPSGTPRQRYWDGMQWTEHFADTAQPYTGASTQPYTGSYAPQQPELPEGTSINTPFAWVIALSPLVSIISVLVTDYRSLFQTSFSGSRISASAMYAAPAYLIPQAVSFLLYGVLVVLAYFDWRALKRAGIVRPFHWAWQFLTIVYIIGRTVVLRRRVHRGMAPMWVYIASTVVSYIVIIAVIVAAIAAALPSAGADFGTNT